MEEEEEKIVNELINYFEYSIDEQGALSEDEVAFISKNYALKVIDEIIKALSSVRGMGKIQKVKLYKLAKEKLESK